MDQAIVQLVNDSITCSGTLAFLNSTIYGSCTSEPTITIRGRTSASGITGFRVLSPTPSLVALDLQSLRMSIIMPGNYGWSAGVNAGFWAYAITAVTACDGKAVEIYVGSSFTIHKVMLQDGLFLNSSLLVTIESDRCVNPGLMSCQRMVTASCGCDVLIVPCRAMSQTLISIDQLNFGAIHRVVSSAQCRNPAWTVWHERSGCVFAACSNSGIVSICNISTSVE
jgi:hypothetical protein